MGMLLWRTTRCASFDFIHITTGDSFSYLTVPPVLVKFEYEVLRNFKIAHLANARTYTADFGEGFNIYFGVNKVVNLLSNGRMPTGRKEETIHTLSEMTRGLARESMAKLSHLKVFQTSKS